MATTIDAHHHLWRYTAAEYGWIDDAMGGVLRTDFLPEDLMVAIQEAGVDGTIAVQARQTLEETRWLLELSDKCDVIRGVVGWAPIAERNFADTLDQFADYKELRGLRHILQAERDDYMLREDFNAGIRLLEPRGLVYDILIYERQLPQVIEFVDRHPGQEFVLDHSAKPRIRDGVFVPWAASMRQIARRENVWCKVSGLVTEADWSAWTPDALKPYLDVVVEAFGPARLMAGSDWPVCLVASSYGRWFDVLREYFAAFSLAEREAVFGETARQVYKLDEGAV